MGFRSVHPLSAGAFTLNGEEEVTFSALGQVAREVSGANELWLALVLTHPALQSLQPHQLAGGWVGG